jgi:hypothetical protein
VIDAQVREWFEQTLIEVVLCARASRWNDDQLTALLAPCSFSTALLPRHLIYAVLQNASPRSSAHSRHDSAQATTPARVPITAALATLPRTRP